MPFNKNIVFLVMGCNVNHLMIHLIYAFIILTSSIAFCSLPYMPGFPDYKPVTKNIFYQETVTNNAYPDVNVSGFIEMKLSGRDYDDDLNKLETIRNDEYYKKLPNNVLKGSPKLENRYNITAEGKLDEETSVNFEIIKEPDFSLVGNVLIKNTSELQLGNFNSTYSSGDYINVDKYLNGVEARTQQNNWTGKTTIAKEKSEPQLYETFGNDSKTYKVGKSFLLEDSVQVYVNNKKLSENIDYTVNYYEGQITFTNLLTKTDYLKVIYEFTNPIQDFIPALSRKNFTAGTYTYNPSQNIVVTEFMVVTKNETFIINEENDLTSNRLYLTHSPIKLGSEQIYFNSQLLTRGIHYFIKNDTGLIRFTGKVLNLDDEIKIEYQYFKTKTEQELFFGNNTPGPYPLKHPHILEQTLKVSLNGMEAREFIDYIFRQNSSTIEFLYPVYSNKVFKVNYTYKESIEKSTDFKDAPYSVSVTYLNESTVVRKGEALFIENEAGTVSGNTITLQNNPIDPNKPLQIFNNGEEIDESNYTINFYEGTVLFDSGIALDNITSSYYYIDSILTEYSFRGKWTANIFTRKQ